MALALGLLAVASGEQASPPALIIISEQILPEGLNTAADVRWAGVDSVYLALLSRGVAEVRLDSFSTAVRELVPPRAKPGGFWSSHYIAASRQFLVLTAGALSLTWRPIREGPRVEEAVATAQAIDIQENRLLLLGAQRDEKGAYSADGAIAWIGPLESGLTKLKPVLYAVSGPGAREMGRCAAIRLGAARFLADGSFLIMPGVQPGVSLYSEDGVLLRTWDTGALGIDTDCGAVSEEQSRLLAINYAERMAWLNQRRVVDTAFPLPDGAGLVVRSVSKGQAEWRLIVLSHDGSTRSFEIPIQQKGEYLHLRGDYRSGRIVFLLSETPPDDKDYAQPHLLIAELPGKP